MPRDLVIVEQGVRIGIEKEQLVLYKGEGILRKSRLQDLSQVLLLGPAELTPAARNRLMQKGIDVVFLSAKGDFIGRMSSGLSRNGSLRLAQYRLCSDSDQALKLAARLIHGKVSNQRFLLLRQQKRLKSEELTQALSGMRRMLGKLEQVNSIEQLMGYEGQAAALYFEVFPLLFSAAGIQMKGRSKRPPRDPVNAILSFGYTILTRFIESAVLTVGLDPWIGCLHQARPGLPALVLDLVEEFRPIAVDSLVLRLLNLGQLKPSDFYQPKAWKQAEAILAHESDDWELLEEEPDPRPPVYLAESGRKLFFQNFYEKLREPLPYPLLNQKTSLRRIIEQQSYHLARVLEGEDAEYQPFLVK